MQKRETGERKEGSVAPRHTGCLLPHPTLTCQDVNPFISSSFPDTCMQLLLLKIFCKEIKPVHPKGNQPWIFMGRTDAEAGTPILWPPDANSQLIEKTLMLGKIEGRRRRGWQRIRRLDDITDSMDMSLSKLQELWWTGRPGVLRFMGGRESDVTEQLNNNNVYLLA